MYTFLNYGCCLDASAAAFNLIKILCVVFAKAKEAKSSHEFEA